MWAHGSDARGLAWPQIEPGDYRGAEWAGATLFVNIRTPGVTFAITGPWDALAAGVLS